MMSEVGSENDKKARSVQFLKIDKIIAHCLKACPGAYPSIQKMQEDLRAAEMSLEDLVVKYASLLRDLLDIVVEGKPVVMLVIADRLRDDASTASIWRLLEWSRFRSHIYAIRHRGDELFEERET